MNDDSDDTNIDNDLNTNPSTIYTDKLINNKVEDLSKRKSQVSIYDFVNVKKKSVSKAVISIFLLWSTIRMIQVDWTAVTKLLLLEWSL